MSLRDGKWSTQAIIASQLEAELRWEPRPKSSQASPPSPLIKNVLTVLPSSHPCPFHLSGFSQALRLAGCYNCQRGLLPGDVFQLGAAASSL